MFNFYGSKNRLVRHYPAPIYGTIIEPFAGSAAYSVAHRLTSHRVILVEKDARVVSLWHRLLGMSAVEIRALPDPVAGSRSNDLLVALAAGRTTRDTPESFVVSTRMAQMFRLMVNRIADQVDQCRHFRVIHGDYDSLGVLAQKEATWFIDPPYQHQGGRQDRSRGGRYLHGNQGIDYPALAEWCKARKGQVIVCEQERADWLPWNHSIGAVDGSHRRYREVWWTNENA